MANAVSFSQADRDLTRQVTKARRYLECRVGGEGGVLKTSAEMMAEAALVLSFESWQSTLEAQFCRALKHSLIKKNRVRLLEPNVNLSDLHHGMYETFKPLSGAIRQRFFTNPKDVVAAGTAWFGSKNPFEVIKPSGQNDLLDLARSLRNDIAHMNGYSKESANLAVLWFKNKAEVERGRRRTLGVMLRKTGMKQQPDNKMLLDRILDEIADRSTKLVHSLESWR